MKSNFELIIFDWDGTLIDSIGWIVACLQAAARDSGCPIPDERSARDVIGLNTLGAVRTLFPAADGAQQTQLVQSYSRHFFTRLQQREDLFDGVYEMLTQLKNAGVQLAVATGKSRSGLNKAMQDTGTGHLFATTRCADETESKPSPLMLHEIIAQLYADPERTLMVGDSVHDLQMAANAGIAALGVACGAHGKAVLQQYAPLHCLDETKQLLAFLER